MVKCCRTCRFWKKTGLCVTLDSRLDCTCPAFVYTGDGRFTPQNGLGYWDQDSYRAGIETGPDFGCVHWRN